MKTDDFFIEHGVDLERLYEWYSHTNRQSRLNREDKITDLSNMLGVDRDVIHEALMEVSGDY